MELYRPSIHRSKHPKNQKEGKSKSVIIDFGRASNLLDNSADDYLSLTQKNKLKLQKKQFYDEFFRTQNESELDKALFITRVMEAYIKTDYEKNMEKFDGIESAQMSWLWEYVTNKLTTKEMRDVFLAAVFGKLETLITVTSDAGVNTKSISKMIKDGKMFDVEGKVTDFYEDMGSFFQISTPNATPPTAAAPKAKTPPPKANTPPPDYCNISGGKRRKN